MAVHSKLQRHKLDYLAGQKDWECYLLPAHLHRTLSNIFSPLRLMDLQICAHKNASQNAKFGKWTQGTFTRNTLGLIVTLPKQHGTNLMLLETPWNPLVTTNPQEHF